ncbi:hypothetical protein HYH03_003137 [Edaphochlamys debaryana]|uniref:DNA polymerase eta n=1 Tax=Edaphochlamys debaryana TaxID=47281 RepID=A0A835Y9U0_9CHLO|nr:hypothetical protein HYH03_003137 [Edaphochlamys debaryana]|eukprot:KAG2498947.1 hypothetical protein HYH03_003137 [Edaphochlamys debaryana]
MAQPHFLHLARNRVVAHIDLDAFYAQVEQRRNPALRGQPVAVVQYNPWDTEALKTALRPEDNRILNDSNGSIIAVSYEARKFGVKRNMMGQQARKLCPTLQLVQVPTAHGKADLTIYRQAGQQVAAVLARGALFERASIDEAYLDLTGAATRMVAQLDAAAAAGGVVGSPGGSAGFGPAASAQPAEVPGLPEPPRSLEEWHVKGLEDDDEEGLGVAALLPGWDDDEEEEEEARDGAAQLEPGEGGGPLDGTREEAGGAGTSRRSQTPEPAPCEPGVAAATITAAAAAAGTVISDDVAAAAAAATAACSTRTRGPALEAAGPSTPGALAGAGTGAGPTSPPPSGLASPLDEAARLRRAEAARLRAYWLRPAAAWDPHERLLLAGALVTAQLRAAVSAELGFTCSAGVSHYKLLAKLGSGLHKPNQQTVVLTRAVPGLLRGLPLGRLRSLGGKYGEEVSSALGVSTVGDLWAVPLARLEAVLGQAGAASLTRLAAGMDDEEVVPRLAPKSLGCGKTFRGTSALTALDQVAHWLKQLAAELGERIEADRCDHARLPTLLTASWTGGGVAGPDAGGGGGGAAGGDAASHSRSGRLPRASVACIAEEAVGLFRKWAAERVAWRVTSMSLTASKFGAAPTGASTITRFLQQPAARAQQPSRGVQEQPGERQPQTSGSLALPLEQPPPGAPGAEALSREERPADSANTMTVGGGGHAVASASAGARPATSAATALPATSTAASDRTAGPVRSDASGQGVKRPAGSTAASGSRGAPAQKRRKPGSGSGQPPRGPDVRALFARAQAASGSAAGAGAGLAATASASERAAGGDSTVADGVALGPGRAVQVKVEAEAPCREPARSEASDLGASARPPLPASPPPPRSMLRALLLQKPAASPQPPPPPLLHATSEGLPIKMEQSTPAASPGPSGRRMGDGSGSRYGSRGSAQGAADAAKTGAGANAAPAPDVVELLDSDGDDGDGGGGQEAGAGGGGGRRHAAGGAARQAAPVTGASVGLGLGPGSGPSQGSQPLPASLEAWLGPSQPTSQPGPLTQPRAAAQQALNAGAAQGLAPPGAQAGGQAQEQGQGREEAEAWPGWPGAEGAEAEDMQASPELLAAPAAGPASARAAVPAPTDAPQPATSSASGGGSQGVDNARGRGGRGGGASSAGGGGSGGLAPFGSGAEVDEGVLAELPWEIREEVRRSIWAAQGRGGGRSSSASGGAPRGRAGAGRSGGGKRARSGEAQMDIRRFSKPR